MADAAKIKKEYGTICGTIMALRDQKRHQEADLLLPQYNRLAMAVELERLRTEGVQPHFQGVSVPDLKWLRETGFEPEIKNWVRELRALPTPRSLDDRLYRQELGYDQVLKEFADLYFQDKSL